MVLTELAQLMLTSSHSSIHPSISSTYLLLTRSRTTTTSHQQGDDTLYWMVAANHCHLMSLMGVWVFNQWTVKNLLHHVRRALLQYTICSHHHRVVSVVQLNSRLTFGEGWCEAFLQWKWSFMWPIFCTKIQWRSSSHSVIVYLIRQFIDNRLGSTFFAIHRKETEASVVDKGPAGSRRRSCGKHLRWTKEEVTECEAWFCVKNWQVITNVFI